MIELVEKCNYLKYYDLYCKCDFFFPLVGAVLNMTQEGYVLKLKNSDKSSIFIVHKFGFSQYISFSCDDDVEMIDQLLTFFMNRKLYNMIGVEKLRIYYSGKLFASKLISSNIKFVLANRSRLQLNMSNHDRLMYKNDSSVIYEKLNSSNFHNINMQMGLCLDVRFWNGQNDCINNSHGVILKDIDKNRYVGICYAAAMHRNYAEIDIFIDPLYRRHGYSSLLLQYFLSELQNKEIVPMWDCYTNNYASLNLAIKFNFTLQYQYDMLLINLLD